MNNVYQSAEYTDVAKTMHHKLKQLQEQYHDTNPTEK